MGAGLRPRIMALFWDHPQVNARELFSASEDLSNRRLARPRTAMPDHICLRLAGGWLAALTALLALVLTIRWYG